MLSLISFSNILLKKENSLLPYLISTPNHFRQMSITSTPATALMIFKYFLFTSSRLSQTAPAPAPLGPSCFLILSPRSCKPTEFST